MSLQARPCWVCDLCHHPWVKTQPNPPQQCPKCRSKLWNRGVKSSPAKTHVLGLQWENTNKLGRETACGIDSDKRPVTLVTAHPTCRKCQAGVKLRGLVNSSPERTLDERVRRMEEEKREAEQRGEWKPWAPQRVSPDGSNDPTHLYLQRLRRAKAKGVKS